MSLKQRWEHFWNVIEGRPTIEPPPTYTPEEQKILDELRSRPKSVKLNIDTYWLDELKKKEED